MKKFQLSIVILSFLFCSHAAAAVFTVIPAFANIYSDLENNLQSEPVSVESNITDTTFLYPKFDPDFDSHPHIFNYVGTENISLNADIDTADSTDGPEMNDRDVALTSPTFKKAPASIVRSTALKLFNFPREVSRLRI